MDVSAGLGQITSQWVRTMRDRNSMTLIQYLQLYGHLNVQIYAFPAIPADYIFDVLRDQCADCSDPGFTRVGSYQSALDPNNYEVIIVLKGGNDAIYKALTKPQIAEIVARLAAARKSAEPLPKDPNPLPPTNPVRPTSPPPPAPLLNNYNSPGNSSSGSSANAGEGSNGAGGKAEGKSQNSSSAGAEASAGSGSNSANSIISGDSSGSKAGSAGSQTGKAADGSASDNSASPIVLAPVIIKST